MGGNAFKENTRRVTRSEVFRTVEWLEQNWRSASVDQYPLSQRLLGSAGKRETSGDIDLNIDQTIYDFSIVQYELTQLLGGDYVWARPGNNQIFTSVPVNGNPDNGRVQVDFMFGDRNWQYFSYDSAFDMSATHCSVFEKSRYKGLFRTELIKALVSFNSDWVLEENNEVVARVGPTFFHDKGVIWRYRYRPFRKDGSGYRVKAFKEVNKDEFMEIFPTALPASNTIMTQPYQVVELILNGYYSPAHCISYESLWNCTKACYQTTQLSVISKMYLERLNSLKVTIPQDILNEHTSLSRRTRIKLGAD